MSINRGLDRSASQPRIEAKHRLQASQTGKPEETHPAPSRIPQMTNPNKLGVLAPQSLSPSFRWQVPDFRRGDISDSLQDAAVPANSF